MSGSQDVRIVVAIDGLATFERNLAWVAQSFEPKAEMILGQTLTTNDPEMLERPAAWLAACKIAFDARKLLLRAAERRFCRAMRRHERRALALGMPDVRNALRLERRYIVPEAVKPERVEASLRRMEEQRRLYGEGTTRDERAGYLYGRAADAAGKLVAATAAAWAAHPVPLRPYQAAIVEEARAQAAQPSPARST